MSEAKDKNTEEIPSEMLLNGIKVTTDEIEEVFAEFFESKVERLSRNAVINDGVYNGQCKLPEIKWNSKRNQTENEET